MEELKQKIINLCNESGLPLEAILFVTKDVWRDVESTLRDFKKKQEEQEAEVPKEDCQLLILLLKMYMGSQYRLPIFLV